MNAIEREHVKTDLNRAIAAWLCNVQEDIDIIFPITTEDTVVYMAAAAMAVLDALQDVENNREEDE